MDFESVNTLESRMRAEIGKRTKGRARAEAKLPAKGLRADPRQFQTELTGRVMQLITAMSFRHVAAPDKSSSVQVDE